MNILGILNLIAGFVGTPIGYVVSGAIMAAVGGSLVKFVYGKISSVIKPAILAIVENGIKKLIPKPEDKKLVLAIIQWAEIRFPTLSGEEKKQKVADKLGEYLKIDKSTALQIVQLVFDDVKDIIIKSEAALAV